MLKYYAPCRALTLLENLHEDHATPHRSTQNIGCLEEIHNTALCDCHACKDKIEELKRLIRWNPRAADRVEHFFRVYFQRVPSLREACMERVLGLGLEQQHLPVTLLEEMKTRPGVWRFGESGERYLKIWGEIAFM